MPSLVTDMELQALLSQKDIASSLAEDLLAQFAGTPSETAIKTESSSLFTESNSQLSSGPFSPSNLNDNSRSPRNTDSSCNNEVKGNNNVPKSYKSVVSELKLGPDAKNQLSNMLGPISINLSSSQLLASCKNLGKNGVTNTHIMSEQCPPPAPPPPPNVRLTKEQLLPPTPSVYVSIIPYYFPLLLFIPYYYYSYSKKLKKNICSM